MRAAIPCRFELNAFREDGLWPLNSALFDSVFSHSPYVAGQTLQNA